MLLIDYDTMIEESVGGHKHIFLKIIQSKLNLYIIIVCI
jgi:hypothetical protein